MTDYLAHSAREGRPPQPYQRHVEGVLALASQYAAEAGRFAPQARKLLYLIVKLAAWMHDLGKLIDENQEALHKPAGRKHLPVHHQDAGAAWLVETEAFLSAFLVKYHHRGLCDLADESTEDRPFCRDDDEQTREKTNQLLTELVRRQALLLPPPKPPFTEAEIPGDRQVFLRMALSCLADADHTDTAAQNGHYSAQEAVPELHAEERLAQLDRYVEALNARSGQTDDECASLRRELYFSCRNNTCASFFSACDSPVGSGKTTAVMAHLLEQAMVRSARRIIVVLPYTSIISQSVKVYRQALALPGENPAKVVGELHFRADFQDVDTRCLTALWRTPIVVTTAVAFFETLASNRPAGLRRLHELPGSMIFVDEAHAALPVRLMPLAWHWMNVLAAEWGCYWVLASGSLVRFWQLDAFALEAPAVNELVSEGLRKRLAAYERRRVTFRWANAPMSREAFVMWAAFQPGPRLVIVNTVQSAAVLANDLRSTFGRASVEHLSTALTSEDRANTVERVLARLENKTDRDWTLVATSCVEAGVDFSFRTGFRETASLASLLQTAGRVNRHGEDLDAEVWSFGLQDDPMLVHQPAFKASISVLKRYLNAGTAITPELCTRALQAELNENGSGLRQADTLLREELDGAFQTVARAFTVIDSDTVVIVPDKDLAEQITAGQADWRALQKRGVSIPRSRAQKLHLEEIARDIFRWKRDYDGFLGYMAGILPK